MSDDDDEVFLDVVQVNTSSRLLIPPLNFAMVSRGVYRSGYPNYRNFSFLKKIGIRSIIRLSADEPADSTLGLHTEEFVKENNIQLLEFPIESQKEPFCVSSLTEIRNALRAILDDRNHPVLVHCDKGKHRTGTVIGCLRKQQGWALSSIFDEYARFAKQGNRSLDHHLIEFFELDPTGTENTM